MKRKNEIIMNDVEYSCWTNFAQNFIDWSMSQKKFKRFTRKGYGSPGRKFKEKFLWCVTIRKKWFSIEIYRGDRHWKKKKRKGGHKSHRNYCFRFVRSTGCPIHTRHYERRYFRHCSYGSTTDCKSFSF